MTCKFKVGDIIIGNEGAKIYNCTTVETKCMVISYNRSLSCHFLGDVNVEIMEGPYKGKKYLVCSKYFDLYTPHQGKILIMVDEKDPNKVVARDLITGKKAEAKCNPTDEWDFEKGAKLAFSRLYPEPEKKEEKKPWTGKVICVESHGLAACYFTVGKIYNYDGCRLNDDRPMGWEISGARNADDINKFFEIGYAHNLLCRFIEYKGGLE